MTDNRSQEGTLEGEPNYEKIATADRALLRDGNWSWYVGLKRKCGHPHQRGSYDQSRTDQRRREGLLLSSSSALPVLVAVWSSPLPLLVLGLQ